MVVVALGHSMLKRVSPHCLSVSVCRDRKVDNGMLYLLSACLYLVIDAIVYTIACGMAVLSGYVLSRGNKRSYISQIVISRSKASATAKNGIGANGDTLYRDPLSVGISFVWKSGHFVFAFQCGSWCITLSSEIMWCALPACSIIPRLRTDGAVCVGDISPVKAAKVVSSSAWARTDVRVEIVANPQTMRNAVVPGMCRRHGTIVLSAFRSGACKDALVSRKFMRSSAFLTWLSCVDTSLAM